MSASPPMLRRLDRVRLAHEAVATFEGVAPAERNMAGHLHSLIDEAAQDYALGQIPSAVAVHNFAQVLRQVECSQSPVISLTPSGGIWAEWSESCRRSVALFIGQDGRARLGAVLMVHEKCRLPLLLEMEGDVDFIVSRLQTDPDLRWMRAGSSGTSS